MGLREREAVVADDLLPDRLHHTEQQRQAGEQTDVEVQHGRGDDQPDQTTCTTEDCRRQQGRAEQAVRRDDQEWLGLDLGGPVLDELLPLGSEQQDRAELAGFVVREVAELAVALAAAGHVHPQLGHPEQAGDERLGDVDRLDPVEADDPGPPEQEPAVDPDRLVGQLPFGVPPGQRPEQDAADQYGDQPEAGQLEIAPQALVVDQRDRSDDEVPPSFDERRQRVQPLSLQLRDGGLPGRAGHRPCHRPHAWAWPRAERRSRRRLASSGCSPGILASVAGVAVCTSTVAIPNARSNGPAATSKNCIRPYGTTTSSRNKIPWLSSSSSSRSAYFQERWFRPISAEDQAKPPTATSSASTPYTQRSVMPSASSATPPCTPNMTTACR